MEMERIERYAEKVLQTGAALFDENDACKQGLQVEMELVDFACDTLRKGISIESQITQAALDKASKDIKKALEPLNQKKDELLRTIKMIDRKEQEISSDNHRASRDYTMKINRLKKELRGCKFFDIERKREIKQQIKTLNKPIDRHLSGEDIKQRKDAQDNLDRVKGTADKLGSHLKDCAYCISVIERKHGISHSMNRMQTKDLEQRKKRGR